MNNLRIRGDRIIGGIIVPFGKGKDKYPTWWDRDSDFALDWFSNRPLFVFHSLRKATEGRYGSLLDDSFEITEDGLYVEAVVDEGSVGDLVLADVRAGRGSWSSGAWPTGIEPKTGRGYVRRWPIVEGSYVDSVVAGHGDFTKLSHVRSVERLGSVVFDLDEAFLPRSPWVIDLGWYRMDDEQVVDGDESAVGADVVPASVSTPLAVPAAVIDLTPITSQLDEIGTRLGRLEGANDVLPTRELPPGGSLSEDEEPAVAVSVASPWDNTSALGMMMHHRIAGLVSGQTGVKPYQYDDYFFRPLLAKLAKLREDDEAGREFGPSRFAEASRFGKSKGVEVIPFRALSEDAYQLWHNRVPYLRGDEAMQATLAGFGDELVPTSLSDVAYYVFRLQSRVFGLLPHLAMPTNPYNVSRIGPALLFRGVNGPRDDTQFSISTSSIKNQKFTTATVTFSAGKLGLMVLAEADLFEDSGPNAAEVMAQQMAISGAMSLDYFILNGDETAGATNISHLADPTGTAYDGLLQMDGLRVIAESVAGDAVAHATIAASTPATLAALMGSRGIIGRDISNLVLICDPGSAYKFDGLTEYESINDVGPKATLLVGQVGAVKGVPIVVSDEIELADANGDYEATHAAGTKGTILLVHVPTVAIGLRRMLGVDLRLFGEYDGYATWATFRMDVQQYEDGGVVRGHNVTV